MIKFIVGIIAAFFQMVCCKIFFDNFSSNYVKKSKIKTLGLDILLIIVLFGRVYIRQNAFIWKELIIICILTYIMKSINTLSLKKNISLSVIYCSIRTSSDVLSLLIVTVFLSNLSDTSYTSWALYLLLSTLIVFLMIILAGKAAHKEGIEYLKERQWNKFLFFPLFIIAANAVFPANPFLWIATGEEGGLFWVMALGMPAMNLLVLGLISDEGLRERKIQEKELLEVQNRNKLELFEQMTLEWEEQRRVSHEYKNQMECIAHLCETGQYDALKSYLREITGRVSYAPAQIDTNHVIINAILNAKYQEAAHKGIVVVYKANDMSGIQIKSQDIALLLSNLLNNAIEACEKCTGQKLIQLKLVHEDKNLVLSVKNTYHGDIKYENGVLQTTKEEEPHNHGIGIRNIIRVIEENNGYYAIRTEKQKFFISIIIPQ